MNTKEYIESGILEAYVLGQASDAERLDVEAMALKHPEVRAELNAIEEALSVYGTAMATPIPEEVKTKIMSRITDAKKNTGSSGGSKTWFLLALAGMAGLLVWTLVRNQTMANELNELRQEQEAITLRCDSVNTRLSSLQRQLSILEDPNNLMVFMLGTEKSPESRVLVSFNPETDQTYLRVDSLPQPAAGKQYQLWAIVDGAPVSMGVFDIPGDSTALIEVPHVDNPQAFAVTLEDAGGVASPTLEEMYVIGNVGG